MSDTRLRLKRLLGDVPAFSDISGSSLKTIEFDGYQLEHLVLALNGIESVPALLAKPLKGPAKVPVVIYQHSHGGNYSLGKRELIESSDYLQKPSFAKALTDMGFGVCAIDHWGFGERSGRKESEIVKEMLLKGQVMWGMMLHDTTALIDYLETRDDLETSQLATIGMSMGGLQSWWSSALDDRLKITIDLCAQVEFQHLIAANGLDHHGFYYYVPGLLTHLTTVAIQGLIAPRSRLCLVGSHDRMCPLSGVKELDNQLTTIYDRHGGRWETYYSSAGHQETLAMRVKWQAFLSQEMR
ncbi:alpha/beta hydrolase [Vagococcus sp. BWB3-3]|uniref:Alpha/beta hydrolase n=1 Tax=Vagococcus allomyrinae TaxID=2794353 RepID=A0A940PFK1_9ENTE|nr:alpha/beta hydrolase [Vagococcus allomyrinae]MBP1043945.1 alpha/beta hydrolase [Vagococcus allomyrinae]